MDLRPLLFRLRSLLSWSRAPRFPPTLPLSELQAALPANALPRLQALSAGYPVEVLERSPDVWAAREALWALDVLDQALAPVRLRSTNQEGLSTPGVTDLPIGMGLPEGPALDVGAKNAVHLPGLAAAWPYPWDLVEIDANRRYPDLTTRGAHGRALAARFSGARYLAQDVRTLTGPYAVITWFLPFVVLPPLLAWGLPAAYFDPEGLLHAVTRLLMPGGCLVIVNQGEDEAEVQAALIHMLGIDFELVQAQVPLKQPLSPYRRPRFLTVIRRKP